MCQLLNNTDMSTVSIYSSTVFREQELKIVTIVGPAHPVRLKLDEAVP